MKSPILGKAIGASFILLLMTQAISAQDNSGGSNPFRPGLDFKNDRPSRTKEQKEYDKAIDGEYQSKLKKIPDAGKTDPGGISVQLHQQPLRISNET